MENLIQLNARLYETAHDLDMTFNELETLVLTHFCKQDRDVRLSRARVWLADSMVEQIMRKAGPPAPETPPTVDGADTGKA